MELERTDPPYEADEREMLTSWLDWHRTTLARKCAGLTDDQLRRAAVPPSTLTLLGLVRHMAEVERGWFREVMRGETLPELFATEENDEADFEVEGADVAEAFTAWEAECVTARRITDQTHSLATVGFHPRRRTAVSLRWVLVHMVEEYARHNGHADLLREALDGETGD